MCYYTTASFEPRQYTKKQKQNISEIKNRIPAISFDNVQKMADKPLTPGDIRKILDVTDATVRNYVRRFGKFLSPTATRKTRKRFSESDVKVLQLARSYLEDGYTYEQTINLLETQPLDDIQIPKVEKPPQEETTAIQPQEFYKQFEITLAAKDQTIEILLSENERLRAELKAKRPWWKFWQ